MDEATIETIFRNIIPENQLSIYEAVAGLCEELSQTSVGPDNTCVVKEQSEMMVAPTDLYDIQRFPTSELERGDLVTVTNKEWKIFRMKHD